MVLKVEYPVFNLSSNMVTGQSKIKIRSATNKNKFFFENPYPLFYR